MADNTEELKLATERAEMWKEKYEGAIKTQESMVHTVEGALKDIKASNILAESSVAVAEKAVTEKIKADRFSIAMGIGLAITLAGFMFTVSILNARVEDRNEQIDVAKAKLEELRDKGYKLMTDLEASVTGTIANQEWKRSEELTACLDELGKRPIPLCPEELFTQIVANCTTELGAIRLRWDAKKRLLGEAIAAAVKLGVGRKASDWIDNDQAQLAAKEVILAYSDFASVNDEWMSGNKHCGDEMHEPCNMQDETKAYFAVRDEYFRGNPMDAEVEALFPDWMEWHELQAELSRKAVGCEEPPAEEGDDQD